MRRKLSSSGRQPGSRGRAGRSAFSVRLRLLAQGTNAVGLAPLPSPRVRSYSATPILIPVRYRRERQPATPIDLTIEEALDRGLKYNLGLYPERPRRPPRRAPRAIQSVERADAQLQRHVRRAESSESTSKSFGFKFPGFPSSVGPFELFANPSHRRCGNFAQRFSHIDSLSRCQAEIVKAAQFSYETRATPWCSPSARIIC